MPPDGVRHRLEDISLEGVVEIRGDLDLVEPAAGEELMRLSPRRGYLFTSDDPADATERLRAQGLLAYDASGALAGLAVEGERLMRRLTDLDLDRLPAAGPLARVPALVLRGEGDAFRVYVPQELGHYVAEAVVDALAGLNMGTVPIRGQSPTSGTGTVPIRRHSPTFEELA
jgi:pimeloyl-ACP methyl ester carboxylesterase